MNIGFFEDAINLAQALLSFGTSEEGRSILREKAQNMISGQEVKGTRILAKSLFKELRVNGYSANQILSLSTELIDLVTEDLRATDEQVPVHAANEVAGAWRAAL